MKKFLITVGLLAVLTSAGVMAQDDISHEAAMKSFKAGDYKTAFEINSNLANRGDVQAKTNLGFLLLEGKGVEQDTISAAEWFLAAAKEGSAEAQYLIATLYASGNGVAQDTSEMLKYLKLSADQGYVKASISLGQLYLDGNLVSPDLKKAEQFFVSASDKGSFEASEKLYTFYSAPNHSLTDRQLAMKYLHKAADQGSLSSAMFLKTAYAEGKLVSKDEAKVYYYLEKSARLGDRVSQRALLTVLSEDGGRYADLNKAEQLARVLSDQGDSQANLFLGELYFFGKGNFDQDYAQAYQWYKKEERRNNVAMYRLGQMFANGLGRKANHSKAWDYYHKAAMRGNEDAARKCLAAAKADNKRAKYCTARLYQTGQSGVQFDMNKAIQIYTDLANDGYVQAMIELGDHYKDNSEVGYKFYRDKLVRAKRWYEAAARQGNAEGQYKLGLILRLEQIGDGKYRMGTEEARKWFQAAADQGHANAAEALKELPQ